MIKYEDWRGFIYDEIHTIFKGIIPALNFAEIYLKLSTSNCKMGFSLKEAGHLFLCSALFEPILFRNICMFQMAQIELLHTTASAPSDKHISSFETIFSINTFSLV